MPAVLNGLEWQTCLRRILFLNRFENSALIEAAENDSMFPGSMEIYRGRDAYGFLLEVICGLNSPLLGETQASEQIKISDSQARVVKKPCGYIMRQLATNVAVYAN